MDGFLRMQAATCCLEKPPSLNQLLKADLQNYRRSHDEALGCSSGAETRCVSCEAGHGSRKRPWQSGPQLMAVHDVLFFFFWGGGVVVVQFRLSNQHNLQDALKKLLPINDDIEAAIEEPEGKLG